ncbi:PP2C family serine/threonine-protein phosphatase [Steroidobacter cummioxidans]|uniref:PP2C family serine/threonine-protein phosphatase n=1 Tax=Steroidobacter cummioxidans TaxID=1803913 RepID=UPI000E319C5F|nr:PP2C family serine/threonine-protein phosphatase [Steroidobacter cummioxidans]
MELQAWRIAGASAVGTSHAKSNSPCQDAFRCALFQSQEQGEIALLMACDGAGSAKFSDLGAELACREFASNLELYVADGHRIEALDRVKMREWLDNVVTALNVRAAADGERLRDYACTLLAAILSPTHAVFVQVGDGAMIVREGPEEWCYIFWPQHGEYINTTCFITEPDSLDNYEFTIVANPVHEVAVFTDGIEPLVLQYSTNTVHSRWFNQMLPPVRALPQAGFDEALSQKLATYLSSEAVCARTDDDKTLLLASRIKTF